MTRCQQKVYIIMITHSDCSNQQPINNLLAKNLITQSGSHFDSKSPAGMSDKSCNPDYTKPAPCGVLGNTANVSTTFGKSSTKPRKNHRKSIDHERRTERYKMLRNAQRLLNRANVTAPRNPDEPHRTRICHHYRQFNRDIEIRINGDASNSSASFAGVQTCGSYCSCPVCAPKIAASRGAEISQALSWAKLNGYVPVMVTFTTRHKWGDSLATLVDAFGRAWDKFASGGNWTRFRKRFGVKFTIWALECTYGKNGFHPHKHVLFFLPARFLRGGDEIKGFDTWLSQHWIRALETVGLSGLPEHAVKVSTHEYTSEQYLAKLGLDVDTKTCLDYEMTGSMNKKRGLTVWDFLRDSMSDSETSEKSAELYIEYVRVFSGKRWLVWSNGFKDVAGIGDESDEELADKDDESTMQTLYTPSFEQWQGVRFFGAYKHVLDCAAKTRSVDYVEGYLNYLRAERDKILAERERGKMRKFYTPLHERPTEELLAMRAEAWHDLAQAKRVDRAAAVSISARISNLNHILQNRKIDNSYQ